MNRKIHEVPVVSVNKDSRKMCAQLAFCNKITVFKNAL